MLWKSKSEKVAAKQNKLFMAIVAGFIGLAGFFVFFVGDDEPKAVAQDKNESFDVISKQINPETIRLSTLENANDTLNNRLESLESSLRGLQEEKVAFEKENETLTEQTKQLTEKVKSLELEVTKPAAVVVEEKKKWAMGPALSWNREGKKDEKHVAFEIPAGTVLKAVLVSGADCSVAVQKPTGPNMVLLRPLDNGQLPRNVRVPLKGSVIIGNAIGDISSERVYIRAERLTLVERNGSFVETEVSAYVSGEDGREGMRGVVVDRSGQIVTRAAFAAFLQGVGSGAESFFQAAQAASTAQAAGAKNLAEFDYARAGYSSVSRGVSGGLGKLSDYYIRRAEQLQPAIQIAAGRVVDVVFTKTVKIGEKDLKKKFDMERAARRSQYE